MFSAASLAEFADKYGDHVAVTASATSASVASELWRVLPVEFAGLLFGVLFISLRISIERAVRAHYAKREHRRKALIRDGRNIEPKVHSG